MPGADVMESEAGPYAERLLEAWKEPLKNIPPERFFKKAYISPWGVPYCIDAMLEHAVMHPTKHRFQLEELMGMRDRF